MKEEETHCGPSPNRIPTTSDLKIWATELGFDALGVADIDLSKQKKSVIDWLRAGFAGEMHYMKKNIKKRLHPELLITGTCRVVCVRKNYLNEKANPKKALEQNEKAYIAQYALGRDYHKLMRKSLARLASRINSSLGYGHYRAFVDSAPVLEKPLAQKAGLGWIGKNSLVLNKEAGSWFFLGEIYTNVPFQPSDQEPNSECGKCQACINVCPTDAIVEPGKIDARKCISYLTIEHKGYIEDQLRSKMGNRIFGCDDCQIFCPWNRDAQETKDRRFEPRHNLDNSDLVELFNLSEKEFEVLTRGSPIRRVSYDQWQRNIAIALGNSTPSKQSIKALKDALGNVSDLVDDHIRWAIKKLSR